MKLIGYIKTVSHTPSFGIPIFIDSLETNPYLFQCINASGGIVSEFKKIDITHEDDFTSLTSNKYVSVGDKPVFLIILSDEVVIGTGREVYEKIISQRETDNLSPDFLLSIYSLIDDREAMETQRLRIASEMIKDKQGRKDFHLSALNMRGWEIAAENLSMQKRPYKSFDLSKLKFDFLDGQIHVENFDETGLFDIIDFKKLINNLETEFKNTKDTFSEDEFLDEAQKVSEQLDSSEMAANLKRIFNKFGRQEERAAIIISLLYENPSYVKRFWKFRDRAQTTSALVEHIRVTPEYLGKDIRDLDFAKGLIQFILKNWRSGSRYVFIKYLEKWLPVDLIENASIKAVIQSNLYYLSSASAFHNNHQLPQDFLDAKSSLKTLTGILDDPSLGEDNFKNYNSTYSKLALNANGRYIN